jgi:uncharacterized YigZ family protein
MIVKPFRTIKDFSEYTYKVKGSVFTGQAYPVETREEINIQLEKVKNKYFDATHHCYAYRLKNKSIGHSDAGEPNGTAGVRIFNSIEHFSLVNILVVVIRYFGGTKLGIGPLGKAYYQTSFSLLESSQIINKKPYKQVIVEIEYSLVNNVYQLFALSDSKILNRKFDEKVKLLCGINYNDYDELIEKIKNLTNGKAEFFVQEKIIYL